MSDLSVLMNEACNTGIPSLPPAFSVLIELRTSFLYGKIPTIQSILKTTGLKSPKIIATILQKIDGRVFHYLPLVPTVVILQKRLLRLQKNINANRFDLASHDFHRIYVKRIATIITNHLNSIKEYFIPKLGRQDHATHKSKY